MGLTVTNVNTLSLLNILNNTSNAQSSTLTRLSTGFRINTGKDDPAGLIALRSLDSELTGVNAALSNNQRTNSMLGVADKALSQVSSLISEVKSLAVASSNSSGLTPDEIAANQAQIDEALAAIDRIVGTTEFNGKKLLDGTLAINYSGVDATKISDLNIFKRDPNNDTTLTVDVTGAASQASFALATTSASSDTTISLQGKDGTVTIDITAGEALSSIASKINAATAQTGVTASAVSGSSPSITLNSSDYGSSAFVRVSVLSGDSTNYTTGSDYGVDASVTVNGQSAAVDGLRVNYSANGVSASFNLTENYNDGTVSGSESFTISGGGATFQLGTTADTRTTIGVNGVYSSQLGTADLGYLSSLKSGGANSLLNDPTKAAQIASEAATQLGKVQGRLGGFLKFQVDAALNQQNASKESLTSAISTVRDADYAVETAELNRQNVLLQTATSLLGLANQQSSQILALLR